MFRCKSVLDIDAHGTEVAREHPAVEVLISQVAHHPATFVHHHDERAAFWRVLDRNVDLDSDARAIADGDLVEGFSDQFRDRARDGIEVSQLGEVVCAGLADVGY